MLRLMGPRSGHEAGCKQMRCLRWTGSHKTIRCLLIVLNNAFVAAFISVAVLTAPNGGSDPVGDQTSATSSDPLNISPLILRFPGAPLYLSSSAGRLSHPTQCALMQTEPLQKISCSHRDNSRSPRSLQAQQAPFTARDGGGEASWQSQWYEGTLERVSNGPQQTPMTYR